MNKSYDYRKESEERFLPGLPLILELTFPKKTLRNEIETSVRKIAELLRVSSVVFGDIRACFFLILPLRWNDCVEKANKQDVVSFVSSWSLPGSTVRGYQLPTEHEVSNLLKCIVTELGSNVVRLNKVDVPTKYTPEEIEKLHPKHAARTNPNITIVRSTYVVDHDQQ